MVDHANLMDLLEMYLTDCQVRKLAPRTVAGYRKMLRPMLLWLGDNEQVETVGDLVPRHYKMYLLHKEKNGASPQYINDILRVIRTFSRYLYDEGYTSRLLTDKIKNVRQPKVKIVSFSEKEVKAMLAYFGKRSFLDVRNRAILSMLFDTGIRCEEMLSMMPEQVQKGVIVVNGKGSKQRLVPLSPVLQKALQQYLRVKERYFRNKVPAPNLFASKTGKPLTNEMIRHFMREAAEEVGVPHFRIYLKN